jgi:L-ascorbate metabolism protein UlaG (beta-lactamase superfamily)
MAVNRLKKPLFSSLLLGLFMIKYLLLKGIKIDKNMIISWHGFNYFKLKNTSHSLIFNPYTLDKVTKLPSASADIIIFSDSSQVARVKLNKEGFVIDSPGEYEVGDVFVYGREVKGNIIYYVVFEGIKIAFLGEFGHGDLSNDDLELIEGADILILPVGGGDLTTAKEASRLIQQVEPRIVIPSCHKIGSGKLTADAVEVFIKEFGVKPEEEEKYKIKKADLPQEDIKLIILKLQK